MTMGADLATGLAASILFEGLKKCQAGLLFASERKQRIDRALLGKPPATPGAKKAVDDLALVIGISHGQYTEDVARFLREIEKSALPEALLRSILADSNLERLYPSFEAIHRSFAGSLPFQARPFFLAICEAVRIRAETELRDNKGLYKFIAAQNEKMEGYLTNILRSLENVNVDGSSTLFRLN